MVRSAQAAAALCCALAVGVLFAGPAAAAGTDTPPSPVCYTYFPSEVPTDVDTDTAAPSDTGVATDPGAPSDSTAPTDADVASATDVATDSSAPADAGVSTDTALPTDEPSGPYTACAEPGMAGGGAGHGTTDPLAYSGNNYALLALVAAGLLGLGIALSMLTARRGSRHTH